MRKEGIRVKHSLNEFVFNQHVQYLEVKNHEEKCWKKKKEELNIFHIHYEE